MHSQKTIIVIAGPTAVGKTAVAINVAKHFGTEIISADSRQCFKELAIGVARPSAEELAAVPHHFIASHPVEQKVTAATFEDYALEKTADLFEPHNVVVMVGGTGLYIKAFTDGMDAIPAVPADLHAEVVAGYQQNGLAWLRKEIQANDPLFWQQGENQNPQRMMRALEVVRATGSSILQFQKGAKAPRDFSVIKIGLDIPRENLRRNIDARVDQMMTDGLLEEVRSLLPKRDLNALQTVGYKELFDYFDNKASLPEAVEAIKVHTRQYAKRQLTWFRKDKDFTWLPPDVEAVLANIHQQLAAGGPASPARR